MKVSKKRESKVENRVRDERPRKEVEVNVLWERN